MFLGNTEQLPKAAVRSSDVRRASGVARFMLSRMLSLRAGGVELERLGLEVVHAGNKKRYGVGRRS